MKLNKTGLFLFLFVPLLCSADTLDTAVSEQEQGKHPEAVNHFEKWLLENADNDKLPDVLSLYFESVRDISRSLRFLSELQTLCSDRENSKTIFLHRAFLEEASGNVSGAQQMFEFSNMRSTERSDVANFFHSIRLLISIGELGRAEAQAMAVITTARDEELVIRAKLLLAYINHLQGKQQEGEDIFRQTGARIDRMDLNDLYLFHILAEIYGNRQFEEEAAERLREEYGNSLEYFELQGRNAVVIEPSLHFLQSSAGGEADTQAASREDDSVRIQTGIFSKRGERGVTRQGARTGRVYG